ncbi:MAG TPA: DNA polymerase III subunit beta [Patescibacteria group bacterium]|nr:DNA polymerase III subunit beta [Patescibacteria group bacterium]
MTKNNKEKIKFSCLQENLTKGLNQNTKIAGTGKTNLEILDNVLIKAEKGHLTLITTNLQIAVKTKVRAKIKSQGKTTVPAKLLNDYIKLLPNKAINFEEKNNNLVIDNKNQKTNIKVTDPEDFPIVPKVDRKNKIKISASKFKDALESTYFTISSGEIRSEISGALFDFNKDNKNILTIVGTDSYRLAEKKVKIKDYDKKKSIIVPLTTLQEVIRIINDNSEEDLNIYISENQILFEYKDTEITSRLITGDYPDYKETIPETWVTECKFKKQDLINAVKQASFFVKEGINDITLDVKNNELVVSSLNSQIGESTTKINAEIDGDKNKIVFNYRYLLDGLLHVKGEEIVLRLVNDNTPGIITSPEHESYFYLIMPIKV